MALFQWPQLPTDVVRAYEGRRPGRGEAGALILWATWTVEGLLYLDELDNRHHGQCLSVPGDPNIINIAHVRWATGSAITALDLCAAALGRDYCGNNVGQEFDMRDFDVSAAKKEARKKEIGAQVARLPVAAAAWIDAVVGDQRYKDVQGARNPLTHARLKRQLYMSGPNHTEFVVAATGNALRTRELVCRSRDLATERVAAFLAVIEALP
jgi:hypothetical protein